MSDWIQANQRHLMAALGVLKQALVRHARSKRDEAVPESDAAEKLAEAEKGMPDRPSLHVLAEAFGLSDFERDVVLLCAGMELDAAVPTLCAQAQGDTRRTFPTLGLALAALPGAHWSALTPAGPLRRWKLVEIGRGESVTQGPLRIDERVLHFLTGVQYLDDRLSGFVRPTPPPEELPESHRAVADRIAGLWDAPPPRPVIQLCGEAGVDLPMVASAACATLGVRVHVLRAADLPATATERENFARLWEREAVLTGSGLLIECEESSPNLEAFLSSVQGMILLAGREAASVQGRPVVRLDVKRPAPDEQRKAWRQALGPLAKEADGAIDTVVSQFSLGTPAIRGAALQIAGKREGSLRRALWDASRVQARPRLESLAQRIEPSAGWEDLVLPELQMQTLRSMAAAVRQRARVYETWGFGRGSRGLGISALYAGPSGTGKTMAAEVLARDLDLDLYRIDLSSVVSKYIGETEKNLRRVFDAAEQGGAILLFDEADALFGKRSEVKDSHDRYANIEVSYLLQRMEAYRGLAILTTNLKTSLDTAFIRRIRFVVPFPFPDAEQRARIWERIFPEETPTERLDSRKLGRLGVAGGNIRNIALNAAFRAADDDQPVRMKHLRLAARDEYAKLEKPFSDSEVRDWL